MGEVAQRRIMLVSFVIGLAALAYMALRPVQPLVPQPGAALNLPAAEAPQPVSSSLSSVSSPNAWGMEGADPARTRAVADSLRLPLIRRTLMTIAGTSESNSPPVISGNTLIVEAPKALHAYNLRNGQLRWQFALKGLYFSPAIAGNLVLLRSEEANQGEVIALDLVSGRKLWGFALEDVSSQVNSFYGGHLTSPVVVDGTVFVGAAKNLHAIDARSGRTVWTFNAQDYVTSGAAVAGDRVFFSDFKYLYAVDRRTGQMLWFTPLDSAFSLAPTVAGDLVLASNGDALTALNAADGTQRWTVQHPNESLAPAGAQGNLVFAKSVTTLFAMDAATGQQVWSVRDLNFVSLPAIAGEQLFVVAGIGQGAALQALDLRSGTVAWTQNIPSLSQVTPVIANGQVYVSGKDGRMMGFGN